MAMPKDYLYNAANYDAYPPARGYTQYCGIPYPGSALEARHLLDLLDRRLYEAERRGPSMSPAYVEVKCTLDDGKPKPKPYVSDPLPLSEDKQILLVNASI